MQHQFGIKNSMSFPQCLREGDTLHPSMSGYNPFADASIMVRSAYMVSIWCLYGGYMVAIWYPYAKSSHPSRIFRPSFDAPPSRSCLPALRATGQRSAPEKSCSQGRYVAFYRSNQFAVPPPSQTKIFHSSSLVKGESKIYNLKSAV